MGASAILLTARILPKSAFQKPDRDHAQPRADAVRRGRRPRRARQRRPRRGLHRRRQQQGHSRAGARRGRHRPQPLAARGHARDRHAVPGQRERDHRSAGRRRAGRRRLQGAPDRHRTAARATACRAGSTTSSAIAASSRTRRRRPGEERHHERIAGRPLRRRRRTASRTRPALFWDGRERSATASCGRWRDAAHAELEALGLPADRPVGIQAAKSPEAIALILACLRARRPFLLPSIELAPETLAKLFGQADASRVLYAGRGGRTTALSAERAARRTRTCPRHRVAAARWRRRHRVHADHLGLDRAAEDRAAPGGRHRRVHELGRVAVRHRPREPRSSTTHRSTSTCASSTSGAPSRPAAAWCSWTRRRRPTALISSSSSRTTRSTSSRRCRCCTAC